MPMLQDFEPWRLELREILDVSAERAGRPRTSPHCPIRAGYATDDLAFEALMSLLDIVPDALRHEALARLSLSQNVKP